MCSHFNTEDGRKKQFFQHILLYCYKKGKTKTEMQKKICAVYREGAVTDQTCFCAGDFSSDGHQQFDNK